MVEEINIKNFKSIANDTISLGRVNVFIGENGCGKSNILEAIAFANALKKYSVVDADILYNNNIRVTKPTLMVNQFHEKDKNNKKENHTIDISLKIDNETIYCVATAENKNDIESNWSKNLKISSKNNVLLEKLKEEYTQTNNPEVTKQIGENILEIIKNIEEEKDENHIVTKNLKDFAIYTLNTQALRGIGHFSHSQKGLFGENLDTMMANLSKKETEKLKSYSYFIEWFEDFVIDTKDELKTKGYKLNHSKSLLYFKDKFMPKKTLANLFSSENANEGILHILFYLTMMISTKTPNFFAIDNIETSLNPHLCSELMKEMCKLAKENDKQILITTHNPAILDGLNLFDDEIRLFEVKRNEYGHTKTKRIKLKPNEENSFGEKYKLSELWTRGFLGAISNKF